MKRHEILKRSEEIRQYILANVAQRPQGLTVEVMKKFQISRQAATRYLAQMVLDGQLRAEGSTKDRIYRPGLPLEIDRKYDLAEKLEESEIWSRDFKALCEGLPENVVKICEYGFTEIVNNAIDHSRGHELRIVMRKVPKEKEILVIINDDGVGIFRNIKDSCHLSDERQAILELSKGKLTTDPAKHTGQGIFFSSRAFDDFFIESYGLVFGHRSDGPNDFLYDHEKSVQGTQVHMGIKVDSSRVLKSVFDEFADPSDERYSFDKTVVSVKLVKYEGESLLSRSQAKRLMARVEEFRSAMLDFDGIQSVGPAFADEIFRVYKSNHPHIKIHPINASEDILETIQKAKFTVLDGHFQHIEKVEELVKDGLMEPTGSSFGVGRVGSEGELSPIYPSYRIVKRDPESLKKILPRLSFTDQEKIKNVLGIKL